MERLQVQKAEPRELCRNLIELGPVAPKDPEAPPEAQADLQAGPQADPRVPGEGLCRDFQRG